MGRWYPELTTFSSHLGPKVRIPSAFNNKAQHPQLEWPRMVNTLPLGALSSLTAVLIVKSLSPDNMSLPGKTLVSILFYFPSNISEGLATH